MHTFSHLHSHTEYSLLDGASQIHDLMAYTKAQGMQSIAITDHGNMFGVPHFVNEAKKLGVKPIIGCEMYIAPDRHDQKDKTRYHQLLLAKNFTGYQNLIKLCSLGFIEGYYYKPRIDKSLLLKHKEGLIATTCCLAGEVPQAIMKKGEVEAEKIFQEWLAMFEENYYIELQRHGVKEQDQCNDILLKWAKKYQVKVIATNDTHYVRKTDAIPHDILLCLQTGNDYEDPNRLRFHNDQFFIKSPEEMYTSFQDVPEALENTQYIAEQIEEFSLEREILLPMFNLPKPYTSQNQYLQDITFAGAKKKYGEITPQIQERIQKELAIIQETGFSGYFLIVQDLIQAAKQLNVIVGPGRGSVVGSIVAYSIDITNVEPIKYQLLFERFMNPERISMPDIDIDFDDEGRQKVIDYIVTKYGKEQVAQIITFGSMAAKSAIKDVARVLKLPLSRAEYLSKLVPDGLGVTLHKTFQKVAELKDIKKNTETLEGKVLQFSEILEGSVRHTGIHAAGVIIAPDNLINYIPLKKDKNTDLLVTQYDGSVIESVGMLKMDFLGLKTLSIIKDTLDLIKENHKKDIHIDTIPLDDEKTFALYQKGDTIGTFQFESEGMRDCLKHLLPNEFQDLIALNALYRPGPLQFINSFIRRKHKKEKITYPHPLLKDILDETYGIMVYQEQIMQTAQIMAAYSLAEADLLRRAMGKKKVEEMAKQKDVFVDRSMQNHQLSKEVAVEIFEMMEKFAQYGFNKSHATAYALIAYQTAFLKANYTVEYMSAVLKHNQKDIEKLHFFINECLRQNIEVLGPEINESDLTFTVVGPNQIRFGINAIKGAGEMAAKNIIAERKKKGKFKNLFNFMERITLRTVNKKVLESLVAAGALDKLDDFHRKQYIYAEEGASSFIEQLIQYVGELEKEKQKFQNALFSFQDMRRELKKPIPPNCVQYSQKEILKLEKETLGMYLSGHPLKPFQLELNYLCNANTQNVLTFTNQRVILGGIVNKVVQRQATNGKLFIKFVIEDYHGTFHLLLFGNDVDKYGPKLLVDSLIYIVGKVSKRYQQEENWELKIQEIKSLETLKQESLNKIILNLSVNEVDLKLVEKLEQIFEKYPGKYKLQVNFNDPENNFQLHTLSKKYQLDINYQLIEALQELPFVKISLGKTDRS